MPKHTKTHFTSAASVEGRSYIDSRFGIRFLSLTVSGYSKFEFCRNLPRSLINSPAWACKWSDMEKAALPILARRILRNQTTDDHSSWNRTSWLQGRFLLIFVTVSDNPGLNNRTKLQCIALRNNQHDILILWYVLLNPMRFSGERKSYDIDVKKRIIMKIWITGRLPAA